MKKMIALGLAMFFTAAVSSMALADGTSSTCTGKKCGGHHHGRKKNSNKGPTTNSTGPTNSSTGPTK